MTGTIAAKEFRKLLTKHFAPPMRKLGFTGSGNTFRRDNGDHYVHLIQLFPSKWGDATYIELGLFVDFLPAGTQDLPTSKKAQVPDCEIRYNLQASVDKPEFPYGTSEPEAVAVIGHMVERVNTEGMAYFDQFRHFPEPLAAITAADLRSQNPHPLAPNSVDITFSLWLARLQLTLGDQARATQLAEFGLSRVDGQRGSGLVPFLERVRQGSLEFGMTDADREREAREQAALEKELFGL